MTLYVIFLMHIFEFYTSIKYHFFKCIYLLNVSNLIFVYSIIIFIFHSSWLFNDWRHGSLTIVFRPVENKKVTY